MLETLDYAIRIGSTPTFLYIDLYLHSAYAAHYVYIIELCLVFYLAALKKYLSTLPSLSGCFFLIYWFFLVYRGGNAPSYVYRLLTDVYHPNDIDL